MTKALIIGAGVAGPTLAMALQRVGIDSLVFERDEAGADQRGSWLNFQANGMDALAAIDAAGPIEKLGFPVDTIGFVNGRGRSLGRVPMAATRPDGRTSLMMPRAALYAALGAQARERGAQVRYGKELVDARSTADGVEARFGDGTTETGDLLIGCDGIHSPVRSLIDPDAPPPRYVPVLNVGGYLPGFPVDVPAKEFRMQFGTRCFFAWMPTPDGGTVWFANPPMPREPERGVLSGMSDTEWRLWLHELTAGDAGPAAAIIDAAPGPMVGWATYDMPVVRHWHNDRNMIVIGDAAHATAPSAGQGAAMALEDAVVLAQCLRDCHTVPNAFATFEDLRRERVERIVAHGARGAQAKAAGPLARVVRDLLLPFVFRRAAQDGGESLMWLQGHHIDFDRPVTPVIIAR
ncbi:FAD-dependent monooxygenase [Nocardia terpenica]|uniref:FAD-dependent oxidoreductase n=1 Tax=Nocardia terpenica TaxID=455432 RepID=UPI0018950875|nr:NAD(P)/FAD-dependent oxidoreductase [Nocardia terpenica]MBF6065712.1 FAD-dependent monooxygenase [Nocardia terpenica]MBF6108250.1 FAD-dependent monooxygenase [Nocardia terpenica]MBF6115827.1 FAD-dependent monooxygenase [Nocardia terpenica]MBF6122957.1 FAD-dependent monooxygenase [Nocardia terpenica]MBF6155970.1 FAD-dependent monooxygenase [Nocardia terpenica]